MSTPTSEAADPEGSGLASRSAAAPPVASRSAVETPHDVAAAAAAAGEFSLGALAGETAAFAATFDRWVRRRAVEAGASVPRLRLLNALHCHGPQKMADLADQLSVTPRNVTALVDGLEVNGLVRRVPHTTDRRVTMVELACEANLVEAQFSAYQASIRGLLTSLDETDQQTLFRVFEILRDRMRTESGCSTEGEASDA